MVYLVIGQLRSVLDFGPCS